MIAKIEGSSSSSAQGLVKRLPACMSGLRSHCRNAVTAPAAFLGFIAADTVSAGRDESSQDGRCRSSQTLLQDCFHSSLVPGQSAATARIVWTRPLDKTTAGIRKTYLSCKAKLHQSVIVANRVPCLSTDYAVNALYV